MTCSFLSSYDTAEFFRTEIQISVVISTENLTLHVGDLIDEFFDTRMEIPMGIRLERTRVPDRTRNSLLGTCKRIEFREFSGTRRLSVEITTEIWIYVPKNSAVS